MDRKLKKEIAKVFNAPIPLHKAQFIHSLPHPRISTRTFILRQISFIRKCVWALSSLILLPAIWGAYFANENTVWIVSAFIPFLALLLITEGAKSATYKMNELEMATRFSLKSIVLARICILGIFNFILFSILILICHATNDIPLMQTGIYLFVPYFLTTSISLHIVRRFSDKEVIYRCMATAVLVSGANIVLHYMANFLFQANYWGWWGVTALLLFGFSVSELWKTVKNTEGAIWNFALTD